MDEPDPGTSAPPSADSTALLTVVLTLFVGGGGALLLIFLSGGFFAWVILIALGIGCFSCLHYFLWGKSFSEEVAREAEQDEPPLDERDLGSN